MRFYLKDYHKNITKIKNNQANMILLMTTIKSIKLLKFHKVQLGEHHVQIRLPIQAYLMISVRYSHRPMKRKLAAIKKEDFPLMFVVGDVKHVVEMVLKKYRCTFYQMFM